MTTVCPTSQPVVVAVRLIPAKGKTAPEKGPGEAAARDNHPTNPAVSDGGGLGSFRPGGFAFSPHCPDARDHLLPVRLPAAAGRFPSVKNAG